MKQTLILSKIERAAFAGAMADVARARQAFDVAQAAAEEVIAEVIAAHKAPPVKRGGGVQGTVIDGRHAMTYDSAGKKDVEGVDAGAREDVRSTTNRVAAALESKSESDADDDEAIDAAPDVAVYAGVGAGGNGNGNGSAKE